MKLQELMTPNIEIVRPNATLEEAAMRMKERDIGLIPVCDDEQLCGMLTDRDITVRATAYGQDPTTTPVEGEDQDEEDAAKLMEEKQIRRLIIIDRDNRLVGIVSLGDLATRTSREQLAGEALEKVCRPVQSKSN